MDKPGSSAPLSLGFEPTRLDRLGSLWSDYLTGITMPYDDFLEEHILASTLWLMKVGGERAGFIGVKDTLLTILFVRRDLFHHGRALFLAARDRFGFTAAFVPSTDLGALSIALEFQTSMDIQALHFTPTDRPVRPPEYGPQHFGQASLVDLTDLEAMAGDFLPNWPQQIAKGQIWPLRDQGVILGFGILAPNVLMPGCMGTGMFTRADMRGRGVGRSIILHLKGLVEARGLTPVPGCWYHNHASRLTLESAGYVTVSKLMALRFT